MTELADTLGVYLVEDWEFLDGEDIEDTIARYLAQAKEDGYDCHTVSCEEAFRESIPFSQSTWEPGTDHDFNITVRGGLNALLEAIDSEEATAIEADEKEWELLERIFSREAGE